ncbi:LPS-assembly protein [Nitrosospira sp. Nsp5]|uniref:LPS-assembly protein LptD n=2 Tax=Nitrosomonadaceae TaxID=206379 RepID=A0ABY0T9A6_9PROT|nr:LPS-assembly protein [Nitrosospira sp. Nsp5]SDQ47647.1 LPS-assembly protein [Nitrosospira multiformis]
MPFQDEYSHMKSRFSRSIRWSACLFCLVFNAHADTPPSTSKNRSERADPAAKAETKNNKPVFIDAERIQGHHEYEIEARGDTELRRGPVVSADQNNVPVKQSGSAPDSAPLQPQQNYTLSPAAKDGPASGLPVTAAESKDDASVLAGVEHLPGHLEREGEAQLRSGAQGGQTGPAPAPSAPAPALKDGSRLAMPGAGTEPGKNKPVTIGTEQIWGHLEQEGDTRLRLGGAVAPGDEPRLVALKDGSALTAPSTKPEKKEARPVFVSADRLEGHTGQEIDAIGKAELFNGDQFISADRMKYHQDTDIAEAQGGVRVEQRGDILEGSRLTFNLADKTGQLSDPNYRLKDASSRGNANMLLFEGEDRYRLRQATYTTCPAGDDDWYLQVDDVEIDNAKKVGTARKVKLTFKDTPILYTPWMDFSFSGKRKTGLLAPLYGYNVRTGIELTVPFYWNIAPNVDATISTRAMSRRGVALNSEFRYLGTTLNGNLIGEVLPTDLVTKETRYRVSFGHNQTFGQHWFTRLDYNRVSDDTYFRDLGNTMNLTSRTNLLQQGLVAYNRNLGDSGTLNVTSLVQQFQTIQDPLNPIVPPYKRLPQVTLTANKADVLGLDFNLVSSYTNFSHPTLVSGQRVTFFPSVSYPMRSAFGYITPKVGLHHTTYNLESPGSSSGVPQDTDPSRTLPLFSVDSSVMFDRKTELRGERFTQTLEPRLFYVYVPFRDQNSLPNFDSAKTDFSFAQILTENRFSGSDRINDANQMTFALTSRLIEADTGKERLRLAAGYQLSFIDRRITLDAPSTINRRPDFIAAISGFITPTISTDTSVQFDHSRLMADVVRSGLSYRPEPGRVINFGYRFTRDVLHQVDASSQWRWSERWQTVTRLNYSVQDQKILEALAGLEYNACCWSLRFVVQHLTLATQRTTTAAFLQLELNGLMQIGSNPLQVLQRSIPGYTRTGSQGSGTVEGP